MPSHKTIQDMLGKNDSSKRSNESKEAKISFKKARKNDKEPVSSAALLPFQEREGSSLPPAALLDQAKAYIKAGRFNEGRLLLKRAYELYVANEDQEGIAESAFELGIALRYEGEKDTLDYKPLLEAEKLLSLSLNYFLKQPAEKQTLKDKAKIAVLHLNLGRCKISRSKTPHPEMNRKHHASQGLANFEKALAVFQSIDDRVSVAHVCQAIGDCSFQEEKWAKALPYLKQSYDGFKQWGKKYETHTVQVCFKIGYCYFANHQYEQSIPFLVAASKAQSDPSELFNTYLGTGLCYYTLPKESAFKKTREKALHFFKCAVAVFEREISRREEFVSCLPIWLAKFDLAQQKQEEPDEAMQDLIQKIIDMSAESVTLSLK